jgi:pimeloyl-ACP methyl ester carboxylesterase
MSATFVLVHGAWHGGWCWRQVATALRAAGHEVHTPTLTGLGERSHLLTNAVDLDTHVRDVLAVLEYEQLHDVEIVGHSYGSLPATLAAVRAPDRIRQLVCLDGFVPEAGETATGLLPAHVATHYRDSAVEQGGVRVIPPRPLERLGVTDQAAIRWLGSRLVPQPLTTYLQPVRSGASQLQIPAVYLQCSGWPSPFDHMVRRAAALGWRTDRLHADHEIMATDPGRLVEALLALLPEPMATSARGVGDGVSRPHAQ